MGAADSQRLATAMLLSGAPAWRVGPDPAGGALAARSRRLAGGWLSAGAWGLFSRPWGMRGGAWRRPERRRVRGGLGLKG